MSRASRTILSLLIVAGFTFGFAGLALPNQSALLETPRPGDFQFQRLHIFLFNLVAGGTVLLWFTENRGILSWRCKIYMSLALLFSLAAFLDCYGIASVLAVALAAVVETTRIARFHFFPSHFFNLRTPVAKKFHHAALLCLSLGLLISAGVMVNNQYLHMFDFLNLLLDDFFLGFSFPLSLLAFAVMFALMNETPSSNRWLLKEACFWTVTVGVIVFFVTIILGDSTAEIAMAAILLTAVLLIFCLFKQNSKELEQSEFLTSGMVFLILTGVTGMLILLWELSPAQNRWPGWNLLFQIHAYLSLYGWNLSGLAVVVRYDEFPPQLHDTKIILLHWVTIALLAPLGTVYPVFALLSVPSFVVLLGPMLFSQGRAHIGVRKRGLPISSVSFWRPIV
jgi:hypothetical protein